MERYKEVERSIIKKYRKEIWSKFVKAIAEYELIKEKATKLWQEYQSQSKRLDMMSYDDENFKVLDAQCDQTKLTYDIVHKQNDEAFNIYRKEQMKYSHVHFFEMQFLELLILKLSKLVEVILNDKELLGKEGTT